MQTDLQEESQHQVDYEICCQVYQAAEPGVGDQQIESKLTIFDQDKLNTQLSTRPNQEKRALSTFGDDNNSTKLTHRCGDDEHFLGEHNADLVPCTDPEGLLGRHQEHVAESAEQLQNTWGSKLKGGNQSITTPCWNPYTQYVQRGMSRLPCSSDSLNSQRLNVQKSHQRKSRNSKLGMESSGTGTRSGYIANGTRGGSLGNTSSNRQSSMKSLHNASPLTYLMKDTKVVDSEKIREPVLRQKYQQKYNQRLGGGYTKKTVA